MSDREASFVATMLGTFSSPSVDRESTLSESRAATFGEVGHPLKQSPDPVPPIEESQLSSLLESMK